MEPKKFRQLLKKYTSGTADASERDQVEEFYERMHAENKYSHAPLNFAKRKKIKIAIDSAIGQKSHFPFLHSKTYALAALLLLAISVVSILTLLSRNQLTTITTAKGERREVILADGSSVFLNANSSISFSSDFKDHRDLELKGEAFFKVARDGQHPFVVSTGFIKTRVLGTSFNIHQKNNGQTRISVNTGKVDNWSAEVENYKAVLTKGQQVVFSGGALPKISNCNSENLMAWTKKVIVLDNTSLPESIAILENWYGVDIDFDEKSMDGLRLSGKFKQETLQNILASIALLHGLEIEYLTPKHIIIRKKATQN